MTIFYPRRLFQIAALMLLAVACSGPRQNAEAQYALDASTGKGLTAFSLGSTSDNFTLRYWSLDEDSRGEVVAHSRKMPPDWAAPSSRLIFFELPAGKYEFYEGIDINGPMQERTAPFSMPFQVVAGKVKYLGSIQYDRTLLASKHKMIISDLTSRDIPALLKKLPKIREDDVEVQLVTVSDAK
jgi:hypothetical protein